MSQIKAQTHLVFVYILTMVVVGLILLVGYKAFDSLDTQGNQVALTQFKTLLKNDVNSLGYGDYKIKEYTLPFVFDEICFVDLEHVNPADITNELIRSSVADGIEDNVFLFGTNALEVMHLEDIELQGYPYFSCIKSNNGIFKVKLEGIGRATVIKTGPDIRYCRNAQDGGLCDGLDIVFRAGYKDECCNTHNLCC